MKTKYLLFSFLFFILSIKSFSQNATAKVAGIVLDENNKPIESVNVSYLSKSSITDKNGFYTITVPANQKVVLVYTHISLKSITATFELKPKEVLDQIAKNKAPLYKEDKKPDFKKEGEKKPFKPKGAPAKKPFGQGKPSDKKQKPESPIERFKFNSGKTKK